MKKFTASLLVIVLAGWAFAPGHTRAYEGILTEGSQSEAQLKVNLVIEQQILAAIQQEKDRQENLKIALLAKAQKLAGTKQGQCLVAARNFIGAAWIDLHGAAKYTQTNSTIPVLAAVAKIKTPHKDGHDGIVLDWTEDKVKVYESNWIAKETAGIRWIPKSQILGYKIIKINL